MDGLTHFQLKYGFAPKTDAEIEACLKRGFETPNEEYPYYQMLVNLPLTNVAVDFNVAVSNALQQAIIEEVMDGYVRRIRGLVKAEVMDSPEFEVAKQRFKEKLPGYDVDWMFDTDGEEGIEFCNAVSDPRINTIFISIIEDIFLPAQKRPRH